MLRVRLLTNRFLYGRNLDFAGAGLWDRYPQLTIHMPNPESAEIPHVSIASEGVYYSGITGVNAAGISFAVHQNYTNVKAVGLPMFFIGEMMLRQVRSLKEAILFLKAHRPGPMWTFVVTDLNRHQAAAIESSAESFSVRLLNEDTLVQTNHLLGDVSKKHEYNRPARLFNSKHRKATAERLVRSASPSLNEIRKILSYQEDSDGQLRSYKDIIKPHTIQTALFLSQKDGKDKRLWVSDGKAPTPNGEMVEFALDDLWELATEFQLEYQSHDPLPSLKIQRAIQIQNSMALRAYMDERNFEKTIELVKDQSSIVSQLLITTCYYQLGRFGDAYQLAISTLNRPEIRDSSETVRDNLRRIQLLSLVAEEKTTKAQSLAQKFTQVPNLGKELREIARKISLNQGLHWKEKKISFNFFTGVLRVYPQ